MKPAYRVDNIKWDIDYDENGVYLPTSVIIEVDEPVDEFDAEQMVSDALSDTYGFCHHGFTYELIEE